MIPPPPAGPPDEEPCGSGMSSRTRRTIITVVVIVIVLFGIIGYAITGFAYAQTRVGNADKTLNIVISHQNSLNTTFKGIDASATGLSGTNLARTLLDQIETETQTFFKPLVAGFNSEMAAATA